MGSPLLTIHHILIKMQIAGCLSACVAVSVLAMTCAVGLNGYVPHNAGDSPIKGQGFNACFDTCCFDDNYEYTPGCVDLEEDFTNGFGESMNECAMRCWDDLGECFDWCGEPTTGEDYYPCRWNCETANCEDVGAH